MTNAAYGDGIPMGLGMALMQNMPAFDYFAGLSMNERQAIIDHTHSIRSKQEMRAYVNSLVGNNDRG